MRAHVRLARSLQTLSGTALAAVLTAVLAAGVGIRWNTRAAGGSDSYGYVSQAYAWLDGGPPVAEPLIREIGVRDAAWVASPLGYRPGRHAAELVPIYPPGLPLLMAGAIALAGARGAFLVVPIAGALAVWCTFLLGRRTASPAIGAIAAALLASNPTFLYQVVQPMSDVPVTALWTACLVLACGSGAREWILAGTAAGLAILVRPNLAPLVVAAALVGAGAAFDARRATMRHLALMAGGLAVPAGVAVAAILWMNAAWYGSAAASGYGTAGHLFSAANIWPNVVRYARAIIETNPVLVPLAAVAGAALVGRGAVGRPRAVVAALLAWCAAVLALYLPYLSFPEWWYTRFLLPAYPAALVIVVLVLARAAARWRVPVVASCVVVAAAVAAGGWIARDRGAFLLQRGEAKYEDAGRRVDRLLPPSAVVLAMQHSGAIRFYGHRDTLRWDVLRPADLDRVVTRLAARRRRCYAVLDLPERERFLERFAATRMVSEGRLAHLFVTPHGVEVLALSPAARTR